MAEAAKLPEPVHQFITRYIDSVAELEGLLLIRAESRPWDALRLAQRLYIDERAAKNVLLALHRRGLVSNEGPLFHYEPAPESLRASVDALAASYPRFLIPITNLIHSKPQIALREFADAFRLREDDK